jgi:hypothetical protein
MNQTTTEMFLDFLRHKADMSRRLRKPYNVDFAEWLWASRACGFIPK